LWGEGLEQVTDCGARGFYGACGDVTQEVLELGKDLLDRI